MNLAATLATLAGDAYSNFPGPLPTGFQAASLAGVTLHGGEFMNGSAAALVTTGVVDGLQTLVVAFRGSDDATDWLNDLRNIDNAYGAFQPLVSAIERYAAAGGHVLLVGHSLGGAIAQIFMSEHPADDHYRAVTFGSPGALPETGVFHAAADSRITNYAISDDPMVFLGEHRAEVASYAMHHLLYGAVLAEEAADESGLSLKTVVQSESFMTADYVNNGAVVTLHGHSSSLSISSVITANPAEHDIATYLKLTSVSGIPEPFLW